MTPNFKLCKSAAAVLSLLAGASGVQAVEVDTGNPDLTVRWDNTVRYNLGVRMTAQDPNILASPNNDDGDRNFKKGSLTSNRLDLLSEFDLAYKRDFGLRVSAAGWYDGAYSSLDGNNLRTSNHIVNGVPALGLSDYVKRYYLGPSGEFLDAFVYGNFDVGDMKLNVKAGKHNLYWGEAIFNPIQGISYGQQALDLRKANSSPGTEAKELFTPRNALSAQLSVNPTLSFAAQYFLDWEPIRLPEPGTYRSATDFILSGGESLLAGPRRFVRGPDVTPDKRGDWGVAAFVRPESLDGSVGLYYRETTETQPQSQINPITGDLRFIYPNGIKIVGASYGTNIGGATVGLEASYRKDQPLNSDAVFSPVLPRPGKTNGTLGNTFHAVANAGWSLPGSAVWDSAGLLVEVAYNRLVKITQGEQYYSGTPGSQFYGGLNQSTKNYVGVAVSLTPTWFQVAPGVDLSMPMFVSAGVHGVSQIFNAGHKGAGSASIGLSADIYQKYRVNLSYVQSFGSYRLATAGPAAGTISSSAGPNSLTKDRGTLGLTFKTTF